MEHPTFPMCATRICHVTYNFKNVNNESAYPTDVSFHTYTLAGVIYAYSTHLSGDALHDVHVPTNINNKVWNVYRKVTLGCV